MRVGVTSSFFFFVFFFFFFFSFFSFPSLLVTRLLGEK